MADVTSTGLQGRSRRAQAWLRRGVVTVFAVFFLTPLVAMAEFTTRGPNGTRTLETWRLLSDLGSLREQYPILVDGLRASAGLVVLTVVLMLVVLVPTMVWVRLRLPWLGRAMEFVCLLPLTIPAIVLVVGLAPVYAWVTYFLGPSALTLTLAYTVLVLPYAYRALDAGLSGIDVRTLAEAARSLGAGWGTVMWRVVVPNIRSAVVSASFLTVTLVLGEFTVANLLSRNNLQVAINLLGKRDASVSVAVSLAALMLAFVLLLLFFLVTSLLSPSRRARKAAGPTSLPLSPTTPEASS